MATVKKTQHEKILSFLRTGKQLTVKDASRLGVTNLRARICELRDNGFTIYTNSRVAKSGPNRGSKVTQYRLDE